MGMNRRMSGLPGLLVVAVALIVGAAVPAASAAKVADPTVGVAAARTAATRFAVAKIYWEYNATANDLGVHVLLDAEDWREVEIIHPNGRTIFEVETGGAYRQLGLTELFFEGAEPSLDDVPLRELLGKFPAGRYRFIGETVDGTELESAPTLSHAIPAGPVVAATVKGNTVEISWQAVTSPPKGFPAERIRIVGYQVIVGSFQVTLPASSRKVTLPPEYVASLPSGETLFEVLAIDASGNQTITEGSFTLP
jgi:hypothetical protein